MPVPGRRVPVLEQAVAVGGGRENTLASDSTHHGGLGIAETSEELPGFDSAASAPKRPPDLELSLEWICMCRPWPRTDHE